MRHSKRISVQEIWKRQQVHEDVRNMYRTDIFGKTFGKMGKAAFGRTWHDEKNG